MRNLEGLKKGRGWNKGVKKATNTGRTHFKKGRVPWNKGLKIWSDEDKKRFSKQKKEKGRKPPSMLGKKNPHSEEWKRKVSEAQSGEKSHRWKGGITPLNKIIRRSSEFKLWREAVFKRDNWTCVWCLKRGGILHPDHIKPFAYYPELRFAIDNGRTLCKTCHMKTDTWGGNAIKHKKHD